MNTKGEGVVRLPQNPTKGAKEKKRKSKKYRGKSSQTC
jgi:hypothetical protein